MTEEISSDPESKTLGDGGPGAIQLPAKSSDGGDGAGVGGDGGEERWKRERWTRNESMELVSAMKQLEEDASTTSAGGDAKWKSISQICSTHGVQRTSVQCRKRWNTLLAAYRKIKDWEKRNGMESYWAMGGLDCKAKKLPAGFDEEIWNVMNSFLAGRSGLSPRLFAYKVDDPPVEVIPGGALQIDAVPLPQASPQPLPQPVPQPVPQSVPQPVPQSVPQPVPQSLPQPVPQSLPQPVTPSLPQPLPQSLPQPLPHPSPQPSPQPLPQPVAQALLQPLPQSLSQPVPQALPQPVPQPVPQPANQRGKRDKEGAAPRKRKRAARQETPIVPVQEPPKPPKLDEQDPGSQRHGFEAVDPLARFLSSFLEKSLESYERNSELNRKLRREQGEKLVAVLGSLSSAVRDLVHSSVLQK